ncbi:MAG: S24 family peptidase [Candidatus Competibacter sp.]|nr:S24 family peptidase [Candidatus Competibacter sp.]MDG4585355.1 S24 family peptidase [Candidatus Competibacter sp.]
MGAAVAESLVLDACCPSWMPDPDLAPAASGWPLLATPVPAGFPAPADERVERPLSLDTHLIHNPEGTFFVRVQGDDWRELGIHHGDLLVVDRATVPSTGSVVVAVVEGAFALRRVARDQRGRRALQAARSVPDHGSDVSGRAVRVWGVVRWTIHRLWPGRLAS